MKRFACVLSVAAFLLSVAAFALSLLRYFEDRGDWECDCDDDCCDDDCCCGSDVFDSDETEAAPAEEEKTED